MENFREVVYHEEDESVCFMNDSEIEQLFEPVKDKDISIITVSGKSKNTRDFVIDFILKLLFEMFNGYWIPEEDSFDWFPNNKSRDYTDAMFDSDDSDSIEDIPEKLLSRVSKRSIIRFSRPLKFKQTDETEKILLIIDLNGNFENRIKDKIWFAFHGLCFSVSSCFILSLPENLEDNYAITVENLIQFTKIFLNINQTMNSKKIKPFETLLILAETQRESCRDGSESKENLEKQNLIHMPYDFNFNIFKNYFEQVICLTPHSSMLKLEANLLGHNSLFVNQLIEYLTSIIDTNQRTIQHVENDKLTGNKCSNFIKSYLNYFKNNPTESLSADVAAFKDTELIKFKVFKANYIGKCLKLIQSSSSYLSRIELINFHNKLVTQMFKNMMKIEAIVKSPDCHDLILKCLDTFSFSYQQVFELNEKKRLNQSEARFKESCDIFKDKMESSKNITNYETNMLDDLVKSAENLTITHFTSIFGDEPELFEDDINKLKKFIEDSKLSFKKTADNNKIEKLNNGNAVSESISHYESKIEKLFEVNPNLTIGEFRKRKKEIELETHSMFLSKYVRGTETNKQDDKEMFLDLLQNVNAKFKKRIEETESKLFSHTNSELIKSCEFYENTMNIYLESFIDEERLISLHNNLLIVAVNNFKSSCNVNDKSFLDKYEAELIEKIELIFSRLKQKQEKMAKNIEDEYETEVINSKNKYDQTIKKFLTDNQYFEIAEFSELCKQEGAKIINEFEQKTKIKTQSFANHLSDLKNKITLENTEFQVLNSQNKESLHEKARKLLKIFSEKYEDEMFKEYKNLEKENELEFLHKAKKYKIVKEFTEENPFKNNQLFVPYLNELEDNVNNSLNEFVDLLKDFLAKQKAEIEIIMRNLKDTYRIDMSTCQLTCSYILKENLRKFHDKVVDSIISHQNQTQQTLSLEKLERLIRATLEKQFLLIIEENNKNTPALPAIGIDLGTTNTVLAYYKPGTPTGKEIIIENEGSKTTPSVVAYTDDGEFVGSLAKENTYIDPRNTVFSVKRLIGRNFNDPSVQADMLYLPYKIVSDKNNNPRVEINLRGKLDSIEPETISAKILSEMKKVAQQYFGIPIQNAVITVPAYFNDSQKQATKDAAKIAGLTVLDIIPEPVAAALAFKLKNSDKDKRNVLVYDLGGGTFDVAVLVIEGENIDVKTYNGDNHLGGDDFDINLIEYCLNEFGNRYNIQVKNTTREGAVAFYRLKGECEKKKQVLSVRQTATIVVTQFFNEIDLRIEITREIFERINENLFQRTITLLNEALDKAEMTHSSIDDLVLVGGSSKIPKIRKLLTEIFPNRQINYTVNADEAVALGACVQAAILNGIKAQQLGQLKISKIAPISLGVRIKDGLMSKIVERNSKIPIKVTQEYETTVANQKEVNIIVFEGEEEMAENNRELGRFTLCDIPPGPVGDKIIEVTFDIKDDGILFVEAKLEDTDNSREISIVQHKGRLSNEELQRLTIEEFQNQSSC